jgi:DNA-binding transcriptional regulator YiaG
MKKLSAKEATRLARNYPLSVRWSDEDQVFVGSIPGLMGDCCHGDTPQEVIPQLQDIAEDLVTYLTGKGQLLPEPSTASCNPDPVAIRSAMGLSQTKFAQLIGVSVRTLHKWEQHTSSPSGAAKTLLKIAATNPHSVREALRSA